MARPSTKTRSDFLSVGEAAEFLGVSTSTLRNWEKTGKLKTTAHPSHGYRVYRYEDVRVVENFDDPFRLESGPSAPRVDWNSIGESEHIVQFYETVGFLADSVGAFIGAAIETGDAGLLIATACHRAEIETRLFSRGIDLEAATARGLFLALDAEQTLSRFMADGAIVPQLFNDVIGNAVGQMKAGGRRLRAFGEMVALLWREGNRAGALRLEELWNGLATKQTFSLCCAYPLNGLGDRRDSEAIGPICNCHSRVLPSESYLNLSGESNRLRAIAELQQKAQSLEAEIAHRREVEQSLARRERELSDFLETAGEGLHQVGPNGLIIWANKAELNLLGYSRDEYVGHHISEFHVDRDVIDEMLARLLRGENLHDQPARLRCKDGSIKHVLVHSTGYFENGKFLYSRCFSRDVTELKEAEERQRQLIESERAARSEAERINRMKDEFLATLSHELRTPLSAISGWTHIIKQMPSDVATVVKGISVIDRNVRAQTRLIEDLLDMNRISAGKLQLEVQQIDMVPVLRAAAEAIRPTADAKGVRVELSLNLPSAFVAADPNRLQQIIWNLLTNAVKFTPRDGVVDVSLILLANSRLELTVRDTGLGIAANFLPHIFERFRQADSSSSRRHGGLGIGLSIVKQLVDLHGGTIQARSDGEGHGANFVVTLPLSRHRHTETVDTDDTASFDESAATLRGARVLVVDDDPDARQLISRLLDDYGVNVVSASSARECLHLLQTADPSVLISDIGMPGTDGHELIREVRELVHSQLSRIPAMALTAFARPEDRSRALLAGFQVHLSKPIDPRELILNVAGLLRGVPASNC